MDLWGAETPAAHRRMGRRNEEFDAPWLSWLAFDEAGSFEGENHLMYRSCLPSEKATRNAAIISGGADWILEYLKKNPPIPLI